MAFENANLNGGVEIFRCVVSRKGADRWDRDRPRLHWSERPRAVAVPGDVRGGDVFNDDREKFLARC
jgi:hypothetical protein